MTARLCVVGATGATGRRVARQAVDAGFEPILAGRRRDALEALAWSLGAGDVRTVDLEGPATLHRAFDGADVVASCVGPFTRVGWPVAAAAVRAGAHYVDTTGEPRYALRLLGDFDGPARDRGVALVTAAGISAVPADLAAAHVLAQGDIADATALTLAYRIRGLRPSAGTLRSEIEILADGAVIVEDGTLRAAPAGGPVWTVPAGRGTRFVSPDAVVVSRYCALPSIDLSIVSPLPRLVGVVLRTGQALCSRPALRAGLRRLARHLPETDDGQAHGQLSVEATVWGPWGARSTTAHASDAYGFTARAVVLVASALAAGVPDGGLLAPSQVLGDVEKAAGELGVTLEHRRYPHLSRPTERSPRVVA